MTCTLFDIAAFGVDSATQLAGSDSVGDKETQRKLFDLFRKDRALLRSAVLLDAAGITEQWDDWYMRESVNARKENFFDSETWDQELSDWTKAFVRCLPPWPNVFVHARGGFFGDQDFGVHCVDRGVAGGWSFRVWTRPYGRRQAIADFTPSVVLFNESGGLDAVKPYRRVDPITLTATSLPLFAFQLSHCRNIETRASVYRPQMPKGLRNKSPKIKFHTLSISDTLVKCEGQLPSGQPGNVPKHVVRGNFAHYTDENKLFGKYTGMFWRPMHIRGEAKNGIVGKEYELAAKE